MTSFVPTFMPCTDCPTNPIIRFSKKLHNCAFCRRLLLPKHKMHYIMLKCRCTTSCTERFVQKVCVIDSSKNSWWASSLDHVNTVAPITGRSGARNPIIKAFILEKMDVSQPFNIHLELLRQGHSISLKSVQGVVYRARQGRWTN